MPLEITPAATSDFLAVAALDRIAWRHTGEPFIADGEHVWRVWCEYAVVLVARDAASPTDDTADVIGATVMFPTVDREWFLHKIMVHPERRGAGAGSALMRAALERADAPVLLTVDPTNLAAMQLYQSFGFTIRQHVEGYYRPHEHRNVMVYAPTGTLRRDDARAD
jgi:ribosomal protein S18 acetylase RimI-like enzyme